MSYQPAHNTAGARTLSQFAGADMFRGSHQSEAPFRLLTSAMQCSAWCGTVPCSQLSMRPWRYAPPGNTVERASMVATMMN